MKKIIFVEDDDRKKMTIVELIEDAIDGEFENRENLGEWPKYATDDAVCYASYESMMRVNKVKLESRYEDGEEINKNDFDSSLYSYLEWLGMDIYAWTEFDIEKNEKLDVDWSMVSEDLEDCQNEDDRKNILKHLQDKENHYNLDEVENYFPEISENTLQYQLSNGSWMDVKRERVEKELQICEKYEKCDRNELIKKLKSGSSVRNDDEDWYSVCRYKPKPLPQLPQKKETRSFHTCKSCGESGYSGGYPFSTAPSTGLCDDCL